MPTMFERAFDILSDHGKESLFEVQFAVYRNYNVVSDKIYEHSQWEMDPKNLRQFMATIVQRIIKWLFFKKMCYELPKHRIRCIHFPPICVHNQSHFWSNLPTEYTRIVKLLRMLNKKISTFFLTKVKLNKWRSGNIPQINLAIPGVSLLTGLILGII